MAMSSNAISKTGHDLTPTFQTSEFPSKRRKLTGRAFYESLGSPKMVLAPMVDKSEFVCFARGIVFSKILIWYCRHGECLQDPT